MNEKQILTYSDSELMKKALGMTQIVKNMDKSLGIAFGSEGEIEIEEGIFLPEEKTGKVEREWDNNYFTDGNRVRKLKRVISPVIRERKIEMYKEELERLKKETPKDLVKVETGFDS